ncbi:SGNH/GDSL hydrolase family protein [Rubellicoccus peritrichatus]|uniref:SGNH/GDSL hydrolase family protein n=1 Tax=Rubellicoccus peritrichatus TaxID=3080537 RepID=A0AAQ3QWT5_9BACT|nr:SGNH/GDSL hydrolase family protein [Puniceicoccus sp. CR14]WOO43068.1 SGNH/GDSL hydrolase family protein [Puniceicoccus sp. CR14]
MSIVTEGVEFFNTTVLEDRKESAGRLLPRVPSVVRHAMSPHGRLVGMTSVGAEIRFVSEAPTFNLYLSTTGPHAQVTVYRGEYEHSNHPIEAGKVQVIELGTPPNLAMVAKERLDGAYDSSVWRIFVDRGVIYFHGLDTFGCPTRPPEASELPKVKWLAYGSSITNAWGRGYPHQAARELGVQVMNKGFSGSCHIEPQLVDYLASLDWDFATCELGVNMRGSFEPNEFKKRATYLLDKFRSARPGKPVGLITVYPNANHFLVDKEDDIEASRQAAFSDTLRALAAERAGDGVFLIEGDSIMDRFACLGTDLLHPSDYGHIRMGMNLAGILREKLSTFSK